jgi:hypothetical protein
MKSKSTAEKSPVKVPDLKARKNPKGGHIGGGGGAGKVIFQESASSTSQTLKPSGGRG